MTDLLLRLNGAFQERLDPALEVFHLLPFESLQLASHQPAHVLEEEPGLMHLPLRVADIRAQLVQPILLRLALPKQLVLSVLPLLHLRLRRVPGVERFLTLGKGHLDASNQPDVFVDRNAEGQDILLRLSFVQFFNSEL